MKLSVPKEAEQGERRVALVPEVVQKLVKDGVDVVLESGAGESAHLPDSAYEEAGASVESGAGLSGDVVAKVGAPSAEEIAKLGEGTVLIGFLQPLTNGDTARALADAGVTSFAMEAIPRISRAQSMDALSSQATVAGYRGALIAASELGRFLPMLTTAAGTIKPAKVLVLGAGVAGLQAIATSRRLGAVLSAFDVRAAVKEQIESLGATFVELDIGLEDAEDAGGYARELTDEEQQGQREALADVIGEMDGVISTAAVPGRKAPLLIIEDAVKQMKPGSVVVDLAAETGGNCELTKAGETVVAHDVKIVGPVNLPATMPDHASQLYAKNVQSLLGLMVGEEGELHLDFDDEIIAGACITRDGEIVHDGARKAAGLEVQERPDAEHDSQDAGQDAPRSTSEDAEQDSQDAGQDAPRSTSEAEEPKAEEPEAEGGEAAAEERPEAEQESQDAGQDAPRSTSKPGGDS
jgi:H+-translocating NAD(P) transhydrogenase subunit alpha